MLWIRRGQDALRWDGYRLFGRPPVLSPPPWALTERVWDVLGIASAAPRLAPESLQPLLDALPRGPKRIALVVPDATRVGAWQSVLPELIRALLARSEARLLVLVATGTHLPVSAVEIARHLRIDALGSDDQTRIEVIQNSAAGEDRRRELGRTEQETPVRLLRDYLEADLRIGLGEVTYHYFAGFGGGPKLVFPGLADLHGARYNHRLALSADRARLERGAAAGELRANPVHQDLLEAYRFAPLDWTLAPVAVPPVRPDPARPEPYPIQLEVGRDLEGWERACRRHDLLHRVPFTARPKLLIADAGGEPRDHTLLQAHKSLQHAIHFVEPGTRILLVAACRGGYGSTLLQETACGRLQETACGRPQESARGAGHDPGSAEELLHVQTRVALRLATARNPIGLWSDLPAAEVQRIGFVPLEQAADALSFLREAASEPTWGFLPRAERFLPAAGWLGGGH
ncbi:MAG: DUF2088 domain-containing protein [Candidatus Eisenbacteria bacterium]|nr:DUF2088 domain-containing protein [Candidatus Eisenbacteria bacterium]